VVVITGFVRVKYVDHQQFVKQRNCASLNFVKISPKFCLLLPFYPHQLQINPQTTIRENGTISFDMSVCLSASAQKHKNVKQNVIKSDTGDFNLKSVDSFQFWLKSCNNNGHCTKKYVRFCARLKRDFLNMSSSSSSSSLTDKVLCAVPNNN
jgi:hypothetical protein